ncbi:BTB/POZ domain-containing protein 17-like [Amphiura filiformis]|uniref:BTB/POZ domain-containing protein 17-like n=1 Tax=Amphiura filiformis TaxID=82378 RepID=UPI003B20C3F8
MAVVNKKSEVVAIKKESKEIGSHENYIRNITVFFNSPELSDVTLKIGTKRFYAHKFVLAVNSEVFRAMFSESAWMESKQKDVSLEETEECSDVFGDFLKFLYSGRVTVNNDNLVALYRLADKYNVRGLHASCEQFIRERIEATDFNAAISWLSFAEEYQLQEIVLRLYDVLRVNFQKVISCPMWPSLQLRQICNLLDTWKIVVEDEYTVYQGVLKWIDAEIRRHGKKQPPDTIYEPLKYIRPAHVTPDQLISIEKSSASFSDDYQRNIHTLLFEGYKYQTLRQIDKYSIEFSSPRHHPRIYTNGTYAITQNMSNGGSYNFQASVGCKKPTEAGHNWTVVPTIQQVSQQPPLADNEVFQRYSISPKINEQHYFLYNVTASSSQAGWYYHMALICYDPTNQNDLLHVVTSNGKIPSNKKFTMVSPANFSASGTLKTICIIHAWN